MSAANDPKSRHRFFRAMVLMGSSLAVGCGGQTITGESTSPSAGGSPGTAGAPGNPNSAGRGGAGGTTTSSGNAGQVIMLGTAGSGGQPPVDPGPFECPPAQWDCSNPSPQCDYGRMNGWRLPNGCACVSSRPTSAIDCAPDEVFVCRSGTATADGHELSKVVPFDCHCAPKPDYCGAACDQVYKNAGDLSCEQPTDPGARDILCGCALPLLK